MNNSNSPANEDIIICEAKKYIGCPYKWGKNGPTSFDCSGFTQYIYKEALGINIPRSIYNQLTYSKLTSVSILIPGDLVFTFNADHVGIYVGNNQFIHAPYDGQNVKISYIYNFYAARRTIKQILKN